ncbi:MAG: hypothetical protein ACYC5A_04515 [Thermoleophilia bacterium]
MNRSLILAFIVLLVAGVAVAGCGGGKDGAVSVAATEADDSGDDSGETAPDIDLRGNTTPPSQPVKLVFIHHSVGEGWLADDGGQLGLTLMANNYFVSDTSYGWSSSSGGDAIGDTTDIGNWYDWFAGPQSSVYLEGLYGESSQNAGYSRLADDPGGENEIVMFKSCFPNSGLGGSPDDEATTGDNPLRGQDAGAEAHTVANAKGIYNDLLEYFATRPDKLFIVITAPPLVAGETDADQAANARGFNRWLVEDWLSGYPLDNVAVFDFYNVLTSNGGDPEVNDLGAASGNHHRYRDGAIEYIIDGGGDFSAYAWEGDSHPTAAGGRKASAEFIDILNLAYAKWQG